MSPVVEIIRASRFKAGIADSAGVLVLCMRAAVDTQIMGCLEFFITEVT